MSIKVIVNIAGIRYDINRLFKFGNSMAKLCILMGGSKGLGIALYEQYLQAEFEVVEFSRTGFGEHHRDVDLSRRELAIDTIDEQFIHLSKQQWTEIQLIINAGMIDPIGPLFSSEPKQWWQHLDVNLTLPISILGRFQLHFKDHACRKIAAYVSSGAAQKAFDGWGLYGASKAGVDHFLQCMALEQSFLEQPIDCISIDPGIMDTQMQAAIREAKPECFTQIDHFIDRFEAGNLVQPVVVAANIFEALSGNIVNGGRIDVSG